MNGYGIYVAALSDTWLSGYDSMEDYWYVFFRSSKFADERRDAWLGFTLKRETAATLDEELLPDSDRIMAMKLPL